MAKSPPLWLPAWTKRFIPAWLAVEISALVALFVAAGALILFALIVEEVKGGGAYSFDKTLLLALRNPADLADPIGPAWLEIMFRDLTSLGGMSVLALITLASIGYLLLDGKRAAALLVAVSVAGGTALNSLLKHGFDRPRPNLVPHLADVQTLSFPSSHAMLSMVTYLTLAMLLARLRPRRRMKAYLIGLAITLTFIIGVSRIYLGVHWPTDVLAGWCAGAAWAMLCWLAAVWLQSRGDVEGANGE